METRKGTERCSLLCHGSEELYTHILWFKPRWVLKEDQSNLWGQVLQRKRKQGRKAALFLSHTSAQSSLLFTLCKAAG